MIRCQPRLKFAILKELYQYSGSKYLFLSGDVDAFLNFIENDTDYLAGTKTVLDAPTFGSQVCSLAGQGVPNPVNINLTQCEFGVINSFQVKNSYLSVISVLSSL